MNHLKITLLFFAGLLTFNANAQSKGDNTEPKNSLIVKIDSLEIDVYNGNESDVPPINLNNLREPTLFILNDEALEILKFSELNIGREKVQSVTIIQDPIEIEELGYSRFNSLVKIRTEENKN